MIAPTWLRTIAPTPTPIAPQRAAPATVLKRSVPLPKLDEPQHLLDARVREIDRLGEHAKVVAAGPAGMEVGCFEYRTHPAAGLRELGVGPAEEKRPAAGRRRQTEQHAKRRCLAGAVRAEKPCDRALLELEGQIVHRDNAAEPLRQGFGADDVRVSDAASRRRHATRLRIVLRT